MNTLDKYANFISNAIIGETMCDYEIVEFKYDHSESIYNNFAVFVTAVNDERRNFKEKEILHLKSDEAVKLFEQHTGKKLFTASDDIEANNLSEELRELEEE